MRYLDIKEDKEHFYDAEAAERVIKFFRLLRHTKGEWAGQPFELLDWQKECIIKPLFGMKRRKDGRRKYRIAYIEIPRKNGKSTLSSGLALYLLMADGEFGAEIYSAAGDREQASIVFNDAKIMLESNPDLSKRAEIYKRAIYIPATNSTYKVLSAEAYTKHGLNAHGIIFDELHVQPNRELWDTLATSIGARKQPLIIAITTAGYDRNSICWEQHEYADKILRGIVNDPSYFAFIAAADEEDDWTSPETWAKANPGYRTTISEDYLRNECEKAKQIPAYQNTFRRLHLNQWTSQDERWLDIKAWDACAGVIDPEELKGRVCYGGLDLASTTDIAAFVLVFPMKDGTYHILPYFWIPGENMRDRVLRDRVPYDAWVRDGYIEATPGNVIDYRYIRNKIEELYQNYNIKEIAFDRWGAVQLTQELQDAGLTVIPMGQGYASMSPPTKELLNLVLAKKLNHGGNPVLRWMADNLVVKQDPAGNIKPDKAKSTEKIDGMVALIMAIDRATRNQDDTSVYEERGLLTL